MATPQTQRFASASELAANVAFENSKAGHNHGYDWDIHCAGAQPTGLELLELLPPKQAALLQICMKYGAGEPCCMLFISVCITRS